MARRSNTLTRFVEDIVDDTKDFVDDIIDRAKGLEIDARDAVKDVLDDDTSSSVPSRSAGRSTRTADVAELRAALTTLTAQVDEMLKLEIAAAVTQPAPPTKPSASA